jgi:hypothetical protein
MPILVRLRFRKDTKARIIETLRTITTEVNRIFLSKLLKIISEYDTLYTEINFEGEIMQCN